MEALLNFLLELLNGLNKDLTLLIVSMVPLIELRGGIIAAALLGVPVVRGWLICIIGNMIPIPFILLFINKIFDIMKKWKPTAKIANKLEDRAMGKSEKILIDVSFSIFSLILLTVTSTVLMSPKYSYPHTFSSKDSLVTT